MRMNSICAVVSIVVVSSVWSCSSSTQKSQVSDGGSSGSSQQGSKGGAGGKSSGKGGGTQASSGGSTNTSTSTGACATDEQCPELQTRPASCAVAKCVSGTCSYTTVDADGDGATTKRCQSLDPDVGVNVGRDCDDADPLVGPTGWDGPANGTLSSGCNDGLDNDCSGTIDDGVADSGATCTCMPAETSPCAQTSSGLAVNFPALDATGKPVGICKFGSKTCQPNGTWAECSGVVPPQPETCDGSDNDCDGIPSKIDSDTPKPKWLCDADSDGHLAPSANSSTSCDAPSTGCAGNWVLENSAPMDDCLDTDASVHPGATELCDKKDNNCNLLTDDAAVDMKIWSYDADGDLYRRTEFSTVESCTAPTAAPSNCASLQTNCPANGWRGAATPLQPGDCNDNAANRNPGALKDLCDGTDYNCDGSVLSGCSCQAGQSQSCGAHAGYDGKGTCKAGTQTCIGGAWGDCTGAVGPVPEICGTVDYDCDGIVGNSDADATDKSNYYCDADGDSFLAPNAAKVISCVTPATACAGSWRKNPAPGDFTDCKDTDNATYPGASERCNLLDDNCDKSAGLSSPAAEPSEDADGDGYASTTAACTGGTLPRSDCWDKDARVHPGQTTRYTEGYCTNALYPYWCATSAYRNCTSGSVCNGTPSSGVVASLDFNCDGSSTPYDAFALGSTTGSYEVSCSAGGQVTNPATCATRMVPYVSSGTCGKLGTYRTCGPGGSGTIGGVLYYACVVSNDTSRYVECL